MRFQLFGIANCDTKFDIPNWNLENASLQEAKTVQVILGPVSLVLDHPLESFGVESISRPMKRNRHAPMVGVTVVVLMGARLAIENKPVAD